MNEFLPFAFIATFIALRVAAVVIAARPAKAAAGRR